MNITAFLQNPWFPKGTNSKIIERYTHDQDFHREILGRSVSGRKLRIALGELYYKIHWDNTTPVASEYSSGRESRDIPHIHRVIVETQPDIIICFGNQAREAIPLALPAKWEGTILYAPHPNKRGITRQELSRVSDDIKAIIIAQELK